ncbi:MAG: hypothetical protein NWE81_02000 [Candidatus Bathyarchaeota archaeon]|jgi:cell division protein FtsZ|nr:hypothetical protein [Candidatus Bathyarchaeota archaeon]
MDGERPTKSLHLGWQGTSRIADGKEERDGDWLAVIGVGEFGGNIVAKLDRLGVKGIHTIIMNTDPSKLSQGRADQKILVCGDSNARSDSTVDLGPQMDNAIESRQPLQDTLANAGVVFIAASFRSEIEVALTKMVAETAKRASAVTIVFTAKPFGAEADHVRKTTLRLANIQEKCDTLVLVDNNKLIKLETNPSEDEASEISCQIIASAIAELVGAISVSNLISLDFTSFHNVLRSGGIASVGVGESSSPNRAAEAVQEALSNAHLNTSCREATGAIVHVTGDSQLTVEEANSVGDAIAGLVNEGVKVTWGANVNPDLNGKLRVTLLMTKRLPSEPTASIGSVAPQLFDLEPYSESTKKLSINLDLYQLEAYES